MRFLKCGAGLALYALLFASCETPASTCEPVASAAGSASCQSIQCSGSMADCKNGAADGCETDTAVDINNCGGCGTACPVPANGEASCVNGVCGVSTCGSRFKDCNTSATDGCEVDSFRDVNNCGACGKVCQGGTQALGVCILGQCKLACQGAYLDCNNDPADGCETNGALDLANCGNCGNQCKAVGATTPACAAGSCVTTACTGTNFTCKAGPVDSCEVDRATNVNNCGACNKVCGAVANGLPGCAAGGCVIGSCNTGYDNCDGSIPTGCETNLTSNVNNCSACGAKCPLPANAAASCIASTCGMGACNPGFGDCDNNPVTGCEINTATNANHCGACGKVCPAGQPCGGGVCISDPCTNYGGTAATVNANIKVCKTPLTWGSWDPTKIPAPWKVCTIPQWAAYAPAAFIQAYGLPNDASSWLWIDNNSCGAGLHREVAATVIPMNDVSCYDGGSCCYPDTSLFLMAVCQP